MKKILYLTNIEVPYRVAFFNELSKHCDLTVVYERRKSKHRNSQWSKCLINNYKALYLDKGIKMGSEESFSLSIINIVKLKWDVVIVGCYNSEVQMLAVATMRLYKIPFVINLDGEAFIGHGFKAKIKSFFLKGAKAYLVAGVKSSETLKNAIGNKFPIVPYYFSSLFEKEIHKNSELICKRNKTVLVVGQYFEYKGMDIALQVAKMDNSIKYKFVGMGDRTNKFIKDYDIIPDNIEIIPFLQKEKLFEEYQHCGILMLPTRQECWGLVVNEAASFGMPIVSTWGSGAAVEFLADNYSKYLAQPANPISLYNALKLCLSDNSNNYSLYLKEKSKLYSIEKNVSIYTSVINKL